MKQMKSKFLEAERPTLKALLFSLEIISAFIFMCILYHDWKGQEDEIKKNVKEPRCSEILLRCDGFILISLFLESETYQSAMISIRLAMLLRWYVSLHICVLLVQQAKYQV